MVLLIGNYSLDRQQSMQRFGTMMLHGLNASGIPAKLIAPRPFFGKFRVAGSFVAKWFGYIDKFVLFPRQFRATLAKKKPTIVQICAEKIGTARFEFLRSARKNGTRTLFSSATR